MANTRVLRVRLTVVALLVSCLWTHATHAPRAHAQTQAAESEYQSAVQKGLQEYDRGNFSEAKAFFLRAHSLAPNARTLRGLGMSSYELRNYVEAIDYFQRALNASERPLTAQMRSEVSQLLTQARSFVTRVQLTVQPTHAQVHLDTRDVARDSDGNLLMDPGTHQLVVEAPDHESVTRSIRTDGNEILSLSISLRDLREAPPIETEPVELGPAPAPGRAIESAPATPVPSARSRSSSAGPWILVGAGGVVAVAGGVLLAVALSNKSDVENAKANSDGGPRYEDYRGKDSSVLPLSAAGIAALSVGIAGVAAGLIWKFSDDRTDEQSSARLAITPGGVSVLGSF